MYIKNSRFSFSDEVDSLERLGRSTTPVIESFEKSKHINSDDYQKVLKILQKSSGPRLNLLKNDMDSVYGGSKGKSYSKLVETYVSK